MLRECWVQGGVGAEAVVDQAHASSCEDGYGHLAAGRGGWGFMARSVGELGWLLRRTLTPVRMGMDTAQQVQKGQGGS